MCNCTINTTTNFIVSQSRSHEIYNIDVVITTTMNLTGDLTANNFTVSKHNKIATGYNKIGSSIYGAVAHDNFGHSVA